MKNNQLFVLGLLFIFTALWSLAEDWPMYMKDLDRTAVSSETLSLASTPHWVYQAAHPPAPAFRWGEIVGEDKRRGGEKIGNVLTEQFQYDFSYSPVIANGKLYFGSSTEDSLVCLDAETGVPAWSFPTEGAVRLAPTVVNNKVYFGSDDGFAYCLNASSGALLWKVNTAAENRRVVFNGRMVSLRAVRSGVAVEDGVAYFAAGVFPSDGKTLLVAADAETGAIVWEADSTLQALGALHVGDTYLTVPAGRTLPFQYAKADGSERYPIAGSLSNFKHRTLPRIYGGLPREVDGMTLYGPTEYGGIAVDLDDTVDSFFPPVSDSTANSITDATKAFKGLRLLNGTSSYFLLRDDLILSVEKAAFHTALIDDPYDSRHSGSVFTDISSSKLGGSVLWENPNQDKVVSLIRTENMLIGGGENAVIAWNLSTGAEIWRADVVGTAWELAVADQKLYASTDEGYIYCFSETPAGTVIANPVTPAETSPETEALLAEIISQSEMFCNDTQGFCLVLGAGNGELLHRLVEETRFMVICLEGNSETLNTIRTQLSEAGVYGERLVLQKIDALNNAEYPANFANIVVLNGETAFSQDELYRCLHPYGGVMIREVNTGYEVISKNAPPGAGEWTHIYANPANTVSSDDEILTSQFELQWLGGPGLEKHWGYHNNIAGPLFKDGRMYIPGENLLSVYDAYNGTQLWEKEIPGFHKPGVPSNVGPICLGTSHVFVTSGTDCLVLDPRTGTEINSLSVSPDGWGYVASSDGLLLGTSQSDDAHTGNYLRTTMSGWGNPVAHVMGNQLFAYNEETWQPVWTYTPSSPNKILNSSLCIGGEKAFFLEGVVTSMNQGRVLLSNFSDTSGNDVSVICLNVHTGEEVWRTPFTSDAKSCAFILYKSNTVVLVSVREVTSRDPFYDLVALNANTGEERWSDTIERTGASHNADIRHPTILHDKIYISSAPTGDNIETIDLATGANETNPNFHRGKNCNLLMGAANGLYGHSGSCAFMDPKNGVHIEIASEIRTRCWIGMIPAGGLVMMPEGGTGCLCTYPLKHTIVVAPKTEAGAAVQDADSDGLPDWWEKHYFGDTTSADASAICSNGVNTLLEAYTAVISPTDPDAQFSISELQQNHSEIVLRWPSIPGRVCNVYWSTNLANGFQLLESNITATSYSDTNFVNKGAGFYKIEIK